MIKINNLNDLKDIDFRTSQGKKILKNYGVKNKVDLIQLVKKDHQNNKNTSSKRKKKTNLDKKEDIQLSKVIYIQRWIRNYFELEKKIYGPARFNLNLSINDRDFMTLEPLCELEKIKFFSYYDNNLIYSFDITSLEELFKKNKFINPYNQKILNQDIIDLVKERIEKYNFFLIQDLKCQKNEDNKSINFNNTIQKKKKTNKSLYSNTINIVERLSKGNLNPLYNLDCYNLNRRVTDLFLNIDKLDFVTNVKWFNDLSLEKSKDFYKYLEDLWNYRCQLTFEQKKKIVTNGIICDIPIYKINKINNILFIKTIILEQIEKLITQGQSKNDQVLGAIYILTSLTSVNQDAANTFPWLIQD